MELHIINYIVLIIIITVSFTETLVADWGEECEYTAECGDHRLVCEEVKIEGNVSKICVCDRFHVWNGTENGCIRAMSIEEILEIIQEKYNISAHIEYEANFIFVAQIGAGIFVMAVGFLCILSVFAYCYVMWKQDIKLEEIIKDVEAPKSQKRADHLRGVT